MGNAMRYAFRHFPRDVHPQAQQAAEAAEASGQQGKFWQMHDRLFANQDALGAGDMAEYAADLELDVMQFLRDLAGDLHVHRIQADIESGILSGVYQTPTFSINCLRYDDIHEKEPLIAALINADQYADPIA